MAVDGPGSQTPATVNAPGSQTPATVNAPGSQTLATTVNAPGSQTPATVNAPGSQTLATVNAPGSQTPATVNAPGSQTPATVNAPGSQTAATVNAPGSQTPATTTTQVRLEINHEKGGVSGRGAGKNSFFERTVTKGGGAESDAHVACKSDLRAAVLDVCRAPDECRPLPILESSIVTWPVELQAFRARLRQFISGLSEGEQAGLGPKLRSAGGAPWRCGGDAKLHLAPRKSSMVEQTEESVKLNALKFPRRPFCRGEELAKSAEFFPLFPPFSP